MRYHAQKEIKYGVPNQHVEHVVAVPLAYVANVPDANPECKGKKETLEAYDWKPD